MVRETNGPIIGRTDIGGAGRRRSGGRAARVALRQDGAAAQVVHPGMEGGAALADVVFGRVNPSGHLPFSIPTRAEDLPFFDRQATSITYDLWHGYTRFEREGLEPAFEFGFGLGYSRFEFSAASARGARSPPRSRCAGSVNLARRSR